MKEPSNKGNKTFDTMGHEISRNVSSLINKFFQYLFFSLFIQLKLDILLKINRSLIKIELFFRQRKIHIDKTSPKTQFQKIK